MDMTCAYCLAGRCGHEACATPGFGRPAATQVQGTLCCEGCVPVLLEMTFGPALPLRPSSGPGPLAFTHSGMGVCNKGRVHAPPCDYGNGI